MTRLLQRAAEKGKALLVRYDDAGDFCGFEMIPFPPDSSSAGDADAFSDHDASEENGPDRLRS